MSLLCFTFLLCFVTQCNSECLTKVTDGGTQSPEACVFPFIYRSRRFEKCTKLFDPEGLLWCSVEVDARGRHVVSRERWGHCTESCNQELQVQRPLPLKQQECTTSKGPCHFPFRFRGQLFNECTVQYAKDNKPWCGTKVNSQGAVFGKNWGHCICNQHSTNPVTSRPDARCPSATEDAILDASADGTYLPTEEDLSFQCGKQRLKKFAPTRIFGGEATKLQEFPFATLLVYVKTGRKLYSCGGSLINRRYVLTAAHCIGRASEMRPKFVLLGEYDQSSECDCVDNLCAPLSQEVPIEDIAVHAQYRPRSSQANDIALVRLSTAAYINQGVSTVCLPQSPDDFLETKNQITTVVGWGTTIPFETASFQKNGISTPIIQKVEVPIVDQATCSRQFGGRGITPQKICAGKLGADSCQGDSGGPLLYRSDSYSPWYIIGVVSYGSSNCGNGNAGVYTRVTKYIDWIEENIKP